MAISEALPALGLCGVQPRADRCNAAQAAEIHHANVKRLLAEVRREPGPVDWRKARKSFNAMGSITLQVCGRPTLVPERYPSINKPAPSLKRVLSGAAAARRLASRSGDGDAGGASETAPPAVVAQDSEETVVDEEEGGGGEAGPSGVARDEED